MRSKNLIYLCLFLALPLWGFGQDDAMVKSIGQRFGLYTERAIQEKMYLHLDRPFYLIGETMWFKAYNFDGASHRFLDLSKVAYLEVLDNENNAMAQTKFSLLDGKGNGSLILPATIGSGTYKVRCYTNWMKNFSPDYFFETSVTILNPFVRFDPDKVAKEDVGYDVQFFPEGGHLVKNTESKIAFRAVGKDGKGISFTGAIVDQQNNTIVKFEPARHGIGSFMMVPEAGNSYIAKIRDSKGREFSYPLPKVEEQGLVMQVKDTTNNRIKITVNGQLSSDAPVEVYVLSHTRQTRQYVEKKMLTKEGVVFLLDKSRLGEGVSHITIFNEKLKPVCERLYFKRPSSKLAIDAKVGKTFITREKVALDLSANSGAGTPELTNMSVSVFLVDSISTNPQLDMTSFLWLTSDLRGNVESPEYYFQNVNSETDLALDNLMLTHGWRRLKWEKVFAATTVEFEHLPEYDGHFMFGKIVGKSDGAPAANVGAFLAAPDVPALLYVTQSDPKGNVMFELRNFIGQKEITIQTDLRHDSTYRFEMASPFSKQFSSQIVPAFYFDKTLENTLLTRSINMQTVNAYQPTVFSQKKAVLKDSLAFFGMPDEKYFLDDFTRFPTMEEVLREYVRGILVRRRQKQFHFRMIDKLLPNTFYTTDPLVLLDGIPIFDTDKFMEIDPLKVKKIELASSRYFLGPMTFTGIASFTTYKSDLGGFELNPNVLVMPYEGVQAQREFYSPKYDSGNASSRIADFRNLMYWAPDVTTDATGKAHVEFNTSDQVGQYKVVIQGVTPSGIPGSKSVTFEVGKRNF
jgi:hypothetical protein